MAFAPPLHSMFLLATGFALGAGGAVLYFNNVAHTSLAEQGIDYIGKAAQEPTAELAKTAPKIGSQNSLSGTQTALVQQPELINLAPQSSPLAAKSHTASMSLAPENAIDLERLAIELGGSGFAKGSHTDIQIQQLFERWSQIDFDAALHFIEYRQWDAAILGVQDELANTGLTVLSRLRPDTMLQWAESGLALGVLSDQSSIVYQQLAQSDPQRALYALMNGQTQQQQHDSAGHVYAVGLVLEQWSKANPSKAWQWLLANNRNGLLDQFQGRILSDWAQSEPDTAIAALNALAPSLQTSSLFKHYAVSLVKQDPAKAFAWAVNIEDDTLREHTLDTVAYHWASTHPNEVVTHLNTIADPAIRHQLLRSAGPAIASEMVALNPQNAIDWTNTLALDEQAYLKPIAFQNWFQKDADDAAQWLSEQGDPDANALYLSNVASSLPYSNLPVAIELFPSLSANLQEDMAGPIALSLYEQDDPSVDNWVSALPSKELQNKAQSGLLYASIRNEPIRALELANAYTGSDRHTVLTTAATEVHQQHPGVLEQWLDSAYLSEKERHDISQALVRQPSRF